MKKQHLLFLFNCIIGIAFAQHTIDLSTVSPPAIEYLKSENAGPASKEISVNNLYMEEGGVPQLPVRGEIHYNRMDTKYWRDALLQMKSSGIHIVATYCIWSLHEEFEGETTWAGHQNLRRFIHLCSKLDLKVHLRIGPYCNAEIKNGGLPDWLVKNKNLNIHSNDPLYLAYTRRWYQAIYKQIEGLLYKDGGPIMALQLENEYVKQGMIIPHLLQLKKIAMKTGFDVPIYSMTHCTDSEYPNGEIIPYAGFYIEAPRTASGKDEIPTSNFEFFTYDRLSDTIGTDIIHIEGEAASLNGKNNDSPFFTCEIGEGTTAFYQHSAVVPQKMAGENINLRLGCGANILGYYMYASGSNPVGKSSTYQSSGPRISYDYQAPIHEVGTLGTVIGETKKYNYFMNDLGTSLAPAVAYLPTSNQNRENLQWQVRLNGNCGYLFCSNYLYKRHRKDYEHVQFAAKLKDETIRLPRQKTTVRNRAYFFWPFNQSLGHILLKYATTQPICFLQNGKEQTFFFCEDDGIPGKYLIADTNIVSVKATHATCKNEKKGYFIHHMQAGKDCIVQSLRTDSTTIHFVTLTKEESDQLWKKTAHQKEHVAISPSCLIYDKNKSTLISDTLSVPVWIFEKGHFKKQTLQATHHPLQATFTGGAPLAHRQRIGPSAGDTVQHSFDLHSFSTIKRAYLRVICTHPVRGIINDRPLPPRPIGEYALANATTSIPTSQNTLQFAAAENRIAAEIEILLRNGKRMIRNTDKTWLSAKTVPVRVLPDGKKPFSFASGEHLALYETNAAALGDEETRMYISYKGDIANAYLHRVLVADSYYDRTEWIISLSRLKETIKHPPLAIRIDRLKSADAPIYFEKHVNPTEYVLPQLNSIRPG